MPTTVVKLGSTLVADERGDVRREVLREVCRQVCELGSRGDSATLVTSGAIALGMRRMGKEVRPRAIEELQASSAVGQGPLYDVYAELLAEHRVQAAQVLLTFFDIAAREQYVNARRTLAKLIDWGVVPVINENDTTATDEISFGDNDILAAQVAILMSADLVVVLSDVDGLYTSDPGSNPDAQLVRAVGGEPVGTRFHPQARRESSFKLWLKYAKSARGTVLVDPGAERALRDQGTSLLPVGVVEVDGDFEAGDAVEVAAAADGRRPIGKGISNYSAAELRRVKGLKSAQVREVLPRASEEAVHRDYFVLA
jgi:glutamate 5-kinase